MKGWLKSVGLVAAWLVIYAAFSIFLPASFPTVRNLETITRQTIIVGLAAIGMTFVIISAAIDLSVGSMVALVTVVVALVLHSGHSPLMALGAGVIVGVVAGLVNGVLIANFRIGSFIATLATLLAFRGVAKGLANEQKVDAPMTWLSNLTAALPPGQRWMILPWGAWLVVVCAVAAAWVLRSTVFGRRVVAIGSSEAAATMCGVKVPSIRLLVFVLAGFFFALSGVMEFSRLTVGDPTVASGLELSVIAAVVIGGASLAGGEGSIFGSLIGALIMTTIGSGGSQLGWPNWIQEIVTGAIIVAAVGVDRWRLARAAAKGEA